MIVIVFFIYFAEKEHLNSQLRKTTSELKETREKLVLEKEKATILEEGESYRC